MEISIDSQFLQTQTPNESQANPIEVTVIPASLLRILGKQPQHNQLVAVTEQWHEIVRNLFAFFIHSTDDRERAPHVCLNNEHEET